MAHYKNEEPTSLCCSVDRFLLIMLIFVLMRLCTLDNVEAPFFANSPDPDLFFPLVSSDEPLGSIAVGGLSLIRTPVFGLGLVLVVTLPFGSSASAPPSSIS